MLGFWIAADWLGANALAIDTFGSGSAVDFDALHTAGLLGLMWADSYLFVSKETHKWALTPSSDELLSKRATSPHTFVVYHFVPWGTCKLKFRNTLSIDESVMMTALLFALGVAGFLVVFGADFYLSVSTTTN